MYPQARKTTFTVIAYAVSAIILISGMSITQAAPPWNQIHKLLAGDGAAFDQFGFSVAISGNIAVIGAWLDNDNGISSGSAYVFDVTTGQQLFKLLPSDGAAGDKFGNSVALNGNISVIGAVGDSDHGPNSGSAHVFDITTGRQNFKIIASDGAEGDQFGNSVAVFDNFAVIGAPFDARDGIEFGSAYVFEQSLNCLDLTVDNLIAGQNATFTITGGTPGSRAVTVYGTQSGQTIINNISGYCATFGIKGVTQSKILGGLNRTFGVLGLISFKQFIPANATGTQVFFQSAWQGTCPDECTSNLVNMTVQ